MSTSCRGPETSKLMEEVLSVMSQRDMTLIELATEINLHLDHACRIAHPNVVWLWKTGKVSPNSERTIAIQKWLASLKVGKSTK